jgi:hypothetical protein
MIIPIIVPVSIPISKDKLGVIMTRECSLCHKVTKWQLCIQDMEYCLICENCEGYIRISSNDFYKYKQMLENNDSIGYYSDMDIENDNYITLIPPNSTQDKSSCTYVQSKMVKDYLSITTQKWESIISEDFCETTCFLAIYNEESHKFQELLPEQNGKETTLADYGIKEGDKLYIIKEHTFSDTFLIQVSVLKENNTQSFVIEIFDDEENYITYFETGWILLQENNNPQSLTLYVSDGEGVFLIKGTNYKIINNS